MKMEKRSRQQEKGKDEMTGRKGKRGEYGKKREKRRVWQEKGKEETTARKS